MAGTLLHVTLANRVMEELSLDEADRRKFEAHIQDYRLGAVLVDLPLFENVVSNGVRLLSGLELRFSDWSSRLHMDAPTDLCRELVRHADGEAARAMALGALTHLAIDALFHDEIERRVEAMAEGRKGRNRLHKSLEDRMDAAVHAFFLGHPGVGTRYARDMLVMCPGEGWASRFSRAIRSVHGSSPDEGSLVRCLKGLRLFGHLHSSNLFPWVRSRFENDSSFDSAAVSLAARSIEMSKRHVRMGIEYMERPEPKGIPLLEIPSVNLVDGKGLL